MWDGRVFWGGLREQKEKPCYLWVWNQKGQEGAIDMHRSLVSQIFFKRQLLVLEICGIYCEAKMKDILWVVVWGKCGGSPSS